jgi:hypothetical protein
MALSANAFKVRAFAAMQADHMDVTIYSSSCELTSLSHTKLLPEQAHCLLVGPTT